MIYKAKLMTLAALTLALVGCGGGGGGGVRSSTITGNVTDLNGNPVRGALVSTVDARTTSSSNGVYILPFNREADLNVRAEIFQDGVLYKGHNVAVTFAGEQTQSVNIVVAPSSQLARIEGTASDRNGNLLQGASVFALGSPLTSQRAVTDKNGRYVLDELIAGITYSLNAGGRGYGSDVDQISLNAGERRTVNFTLGDPGNTVFNPPTNIGIVSYVSKIEPGRAGGRSKQEQASAIEQVKRLHDKRREKRIGQSRVTLSGEPVEVDLFWDSIQNPDLLGYGIYRASDPQGPFTAIDFFREPLGSYYTDLSQELRPNSQYSYEVTALSVNYPDTAGSESAPTPVVTVRTLNQLDLLPEQRNPLRFLWTASSGADKFVVYLFDRYPGIGVEQFFDNEQAPVSGTSYTYDGPGLVPGVTYYYLVLGFTNDNTAVTVSEVGSFTD